MLRLLDVRGRTLRVVWVLCLTKLLHAVLDQKKEEGLIVKQA